MILKEIQIQPDDNFEIKHFVPFMPAEVEAPNFSFSVYRDGYSNMPDNRKRNIAF